MSGRRIAALVGLTVADAVVVLTLRPHGRDLAHDVLAPHAWLARVGPDAALATLASAAVWAAALWLAVGSAVGFAARLPGDAGRRAERLARRLLPTAVLRLAAGSVGLGIVLAPVAAGAAPAAPAPSNGTASVPAPVWPAIGASDGGVSSTAGPTAAPSTPVAPPTWPQSSPSTAPSSGPTASPAPTTTSPRTPSTAPPARPVRPAGPSRPSDRSATAEVRVGDSLWLIAARRLGPAATPPQIAAAWPRWFAANRDVIGTDPDLIRPGQVLHAPAPRSEEAPS